MPRFLPPYDDDFWPDDAATEREGARRHFPMQFEQLTDVIQRREKWLLTTFGEPVDIYLRILPSDPNFIPCTTFDNNRSQSHQECLMCYGTGALGGYIKLTIDTLRSVRLDLARNHMSPVDHDNKRLISNRENESWDEARSLDGYDVNTAKWLIRFPISENYQELMDHGLRERQNVNTCWFFSPIKLDNRDFFVRANGDRYKFENTSHSTWRGKVTHTKFNAAKIDREDILYQVGIQGASLSNFETSEDWQIQEQYAQEQPIFTIDPTFSNGNFFSTFDFSTLFSQNNRFGDTRQGRDR